MRFTLVFLFLLSFSAFAAGPRGPVVSKHLPCERVLSNAATVRSLKEALRHYAGSRDAGVLGVAFVQILTELPQLNLRHIEELYREMGESYIYLVAVPSEYLAGIKAPAGGVLISVDPASKIVMPFYLWIGANGPKEAQQLMLANGLDPAINLQNLEQTGVITLK